MAKKPTYEELHHNVKSLQKAVEHGKRKEDAFRKRDRELNVRSQIANVFLTISDDTMYGEALEIS